MKLGQTGPFDMPMRTSIPWCISTGLKASESCGTAKIKKEEDLNPALDKETRGESSSEKNENDFMEKHNFSTPLQTPNTSKIRLV